MQNKKGTGSLGSITRVTQGVWGNPDPNINLLMPSSHSLSFHIDSGKMLRSPETAIASAHP